jgi:cytidylate kinase
LEEPGKKLGEGVVKLGQQLLSLLKHKAPETAAAIEQAPVQLEQQQVAALSQQVERAAIAHPEVKTAAEALAANPEARQMVEELTQIAQSEGSTVINPGKIGIQISGGYNPIKIEKFEF